MKLHEPVGKADYAPLIIRLSLGSYLLFCGRMSLNDLPAFVQAVKESNLLPQSLATLYGTLMPFIEMAAGLLLILGLWTTLAAMLSAVIWISFILYFGPFSNRPFNKDIILLATSCAMLYLGGGAASIDKLRKSG